MQNIVQLISVVLFISLYSCSLMGQDVEDVIKIRVDRQPDVKWENQENQTFNQTWQTETVANVQEPTMEWYPPEGEPNGTAMVICPGGGMYLLSIESEGNQVAEWLSSKGVSAFVLKYRLVPTGENGADEFMSDYEGALKKAKNMLDYGKDDALNAIEHIRANAEKYGVDPSKIGIMGFSAGGAVTMEAAYKSTEENRPNFIAPIYAWTTVMDEQEVPEYQPPAFILCATDDPLDLAEGNAQIYLDWIKSGASAELHMYSEGGHGFGMRIQNKQTDGWIERLGDWMKVNKFLK